MKFYGFIKMYITHSDIAELEWLRIYCSKLKVCFFTYSFKSLCGFDIIL